MYIKIKLIVSLPICFASSIDLQTDANGNVIYDGQFYREYNGLNQLVKIYNGTDSNSPLYQEYEYDPVEERVIKKITYDSSENPIETVIYFDKEFVRVDYHNGTIIDTKYVYLEGQLNAQVEDDETMFILNDHLGSSSVVMDSSGNVIENTTYSPFGEVVSGGEVSRYGYEGKEHDSLVGDTDFHFRKYKAEWGLFTQPDSLLPNVYDPQQLNRYSFERNNPYKYIDPTGHDTEQHGTSISGGLILGGQAGIGKARNLDPDNPEEAIYVMLGMGGILGFGPSGGWTYDYSYSQNDNLYDLAGDTLSMGGSFSLFNLITIGAEVNVPIVDDLTNVLKIPKPTFTFSGGLGGGSPAELHAFRTNTGIYKLDEKSVSKKSALYVDNDGGFIIQDNDGIWMRDGDGHFQLIED